MLEDTNSLDGAPLFYISIHAKKEKENKMSLSLTNCKLFETPDPTKLEVK